MSVTKFEKPMGTEITTLSEQIGNYVSVLGSPTLNNQSLPTTHISAVKNTSSKIVNIRGFFENISLEAGYNNAIRNIVTTAGTPPIEVGCSVFSPGGILNAYISPNGNMVIYTTTALSNVNVFINVCYVKNN